MSGEAEGVEVAPSNPIEARWGQAFPRLTSAQIARLEAHGKGEGSACVQLVHRVLHE